MAARGSQHGQRGLERDLTMIKVLQKQCLLNIVNFESTEYGIYLLFLLSRVKDPILGLVYLKERDTKSNLRTAKDPIYGQLKIP